MAPEPDDASGLPFGIGAYLLWGMFPLYWPLLEPASALEIVAHRMLWSLVFVTALLAARRKLGGVLALARDRGKLTRLSAAAFFVSLNWLVYIWGVNHGHVVETSLGYFINPLITILVGVFVLGERLRSMQWLAVGIASMAIVVLTVDYGRLPWIALTLACSFASYGFLKKQVAGGAVETLTIETFVMAVPALLILITIAAQSGLAFGHHGPANTMLLAGTGVVTAIPLILFGAAASRLPLTVIGLLQYMTPLIQFGIGVGVRHESMPAARWIGFALVWLALVVLTVEGLRHQRNAALPDARDAIEAATT